MLSDRIKNRISSFARFNRKLVLNNRFGYAFILLLLLFTPLKGRTQSYKIDPSFAMYSAFYDPLNSINGGFVDLQGRILLFGSLNNSSYPYRHQILRVFDDGSIDLTYSHFPYFFPSSNVFSVSKMQNGGLIYQPDFYFLYKSTVDGQIYDTSWTNNYLQSNYNSSTIWLPDSSIYSYLYLGVFGLEYPFQSGDFHYFIRLDMNGNIDTTFNHDAEYIVNRIIQYGSDKCLLVGRFSSYDSIPNKFICRIDSSGEIDTTFSSIFAGGLGIEEVFIQADGKILVSGNLILQNNVDTFQLIRLLPDGKLDSLFNNTISIYDGFDLYGGGCKEICQTRDSGFIIAGSFTEIDGIPRGRIAKIDNNGQLLPNEFIGTWVDSSDAWLIGIAPSITSIIPDPYSSIEQYYVAGYFNRVNGQFSDCIFRIVEDSTVSVKDVFSHDKFKIRPNPFHDRIHIDFLDHVSPNAIYEIKLYDLSGAIALQTSCKQPISLDVTTVSIGVYILEISNREIANSYLVVKL